VNSKIYAENNYFDFDYDVNPGEIIKDWKGTSIYESGSFVNGKSSANEVDLVDAFNQSHTVQLNENVGWEPSLFTRINPTQAVPALVKAKAGTGKLK
jgi:pectate lyase